MPRKSAADLVLGGPRVRREEPAATTGLLHWHHTEFGRRTDCGRFRVVHAGSAWAVLDADWTQIARADSVAAAQALAERMAR
jgi:hypothetical protein